MSAIRFDSLSEAVENFSESLAHIIKFFILGPTDSGKTNVAKFVVKKMLGTPSFRYAEVRWLTAPPVSSAVSAMLEPSDSNVIIVFDDVTFILEGTSRMIQLFKNLEARVRHVVVPKNGKIAIIYCSHYSKGISPFLRECDYIVITGLRGNVVEKLAKDFEVGNFFSKSVLQEFHQVYSMVKLTKPSSPNILYMGKAYNTLETRPVLVAGPGLDRGRLLWIRREDEFFDIKYSYSPKPLEMILPEIERKLGSVYAAEVQKVILEASGRHLMMGVSDDR